VIGGVPVTLPVRFTLLCDLEGWPIKVLGVLGKHLETDEVCIFVANKCAIHKDVVLFEHQLAETVQVKWPTHADKELGVLEVGGELIEGLWLAAVR
jgi:hypothetical protein